MSLIELAERVGSGLSSAWLCTGCNQVSEHLPMARAVTCCFGAPTLPLNPAALRARAQQEN